MELTKQEYLDKISLCSADRDLTALIKLRNALLGQRKVMDKWFDKYLDMFERKMSPDETDTPVWKLYKSKSSEYSDLNSIITIADAYIIKLKNV